MAAKPTTNNRQTSARRGSVEARRLWTKRWLILAALIALSLATRAELWAAWWGDGLINPARIYTLFAPLGAMAIVIRKSVRCRAWAIRRAWTGPLCLLTAWGLALLARWTDLSTFNDASLMVTLLGCTLAVFGIESVRRFPTAWFMLALAIPLPAALLTSGLETASRITSTIAFPLARGLDSAATLSKGAILFGDSVVQGGRLLSVLAIASLTWALCLQAPRQRILTAIAITPVIVFVTNLLRTVFESANVVWLDGVIGGAAAGWLAVLTVVVVGLIHNTQRGSANRVEVGRIRLWRQCSSQLSHWDRLSPVGAATIMALATALGFMT